MLGTAALALAWMITQGGVPLVGLLIAAPFAIGFAGLCIARPRIGILAYLHCSFFVIGLTRFFPRDIPYGLAVDAILAVTLIGTLFKAKKSDLKKINNPVFWLVVLWFGYCATELFNPEAKSKEAWFYAVRGLSLYWLLATPLIFIWFDKREDLNKFIKIWMVWSFFVALWGFKQQYIGLTSGEQYWLDTEGRQTHVLFGKMRSWSIYTDAGQFGAAMAHVCLFTLILALGEKSMKRRFIYLFLAAIYFWGYAVAGSRGPLFIIAGGFIMYLFLIKNFKMLTIGLSVAALCFVFLKYTNIGSGNYQIARMRTALDPNDKSFQVRLENQKILKAYLASRPLGGGIGSGGSWGQRFTPGTLLAETALDSWYVKVWVETGIVGLLLHIIHLLIMLYIGFKRVFFLEDPDLRTKCMGLLAGFFGVAVASYGNQIFGQFPTGTIMYFTIIYLYLCDKWDAAAPHPHTRPAKSLNFT